ncbi:flagellar export protein FliJ [Kaistia sp. 32K]|uniref:flagellar export protein FliJ n=1 Tax=Kaistia sp. 32K TaxID=2795690 RepID=UPI0019164EB2|nr:flagellar export protein FliJ [Kaistia sp. 32K]BCP54899.1 flagellar export protein FliJ [Kaistia sp. 32K]
MKSRESLIRLKRFQADEKRRQVNQIQTMVAEFERMARDLEDQINVEQERAGIRDTSHFAYPTFAKAAMQRRDNLRASAQDLESQLAAAQEGLDLALDELKKVELMVVRDQDRERSAATPGQRPPAPDLAARRANRSSAAERRSW